MVTGQTMHPSRMRPVTGPSATASDATGGPSTGQPLSCALPATRP